MFPRFASIALLAPLLLVSLPAAARAEQSGSAPVASMPSAQTLRLMSKRCRSAKGFGMFFSPGEGSGRGQPLRVIGLSRQPQPGASLLLLGSKGPEPLAVQEGGSGPAWWFGELPRARAGRYRAALISSEGELLACGRTQVSAESLPSSLTSAQAPTEQGQWPITRSWSWFTEGLYAAWIEKLFWAPPTEQPSWSPLHEVIRDPRRNFLYNHLGAAEDGPDPRRAVVLEPDCADLPYYLRAYFAWKLRLPFGYRQCDRGSSRRPARCGPLKTNLSIGGALAANASAAQRFSHFLRKHVSYVHSGAGRTAPADDETDLYPVALGTDSMRPGTVYVDPQGHLLVVARRVPQSATRGGILFAVDGHPDLSVGRKRFWRGAFLFSDNIQSGAGGFKAFRPLVKRDGAVVALTNSEINQHPDYGNHSDEQYRLGIDGFYDRMERIITPQPLPPAQAYRERLEALYELILERVGSVQVGEAYLQKTGFREIPMPAGPRIFETRGPWEDFSTPARDMRLLIAIDEVMGFPQKIVSQPGRFAFASGQTPAQARQETEQLLASFAKSKTFSYTRSDGSSWTLTMADLLARQKGLEMAYNPNDCAELRWAASGKELATCKRYAPEEQRRRMEAYRQWFADRDRPPLR